MTAKLLNLSNELINLHRIHALTLDRREYFYSVFKYLSTHIHIFVLVSIQYFTVLFN